MKVLTSREFNQDVSKAKRFAVSEPVFVTDRGKPTHVLLSIDAYRDFADQPANLLDLLAPPKPIQVDLDWRSAGSSAGRR